MLSIIGKVYTTGYWILSIIGEVYTTGYWIYTEYYR